MHRARHMVRGLELPCLPQACHPLHISMHPPMQKLSKPHPFQVLWRLRYICMNDYKNSRAQQKALLQQIPALVTFAARGLVTQQARLRGCTMTSDAILFWKRAAWTKGGSCGGARQQRWHRRCLTLCLQDLDNPPPPLAKGQLCSIQETWWAERKLWVAKGFLCLYKNPLPSLALASVFVLQEKLDV